MNNPCKNCGKDVPLDMTQVGGVHMYCEYEYFHEKSQRMFKVRPVHAGPWCILNADELKDFFVNEEINDPYEVQITMMSKGEIEALPDFGGW